MAPHVSDKRSIRYHDPPCPRRNSEGEIQRVIRGMTGGNGDLEGKLMQAHRRGRRRLEQRPKQSQTFPSFIRRKQLPADLNPKNVGCLTEPEVGDDEFGLDPNQRLRDVTARFLEDPLERNRRVDNEGQFTRSRPFPSRSTHVFGRPGIGTATRSPRANHDQRSGDETRQYVRRPVDVPNLDYHQSTLFEGYSDAPPPRNAHAPQPGYAGDARSHRRDS
jgi:hypothetical protein